MQRLPSSRISRFVIVMTLLAGGFASTNIASAASTQPKPGGIGVRLIADASSSSVEPFTLSYIVERIAPGGRVLRHVEISNTTTAAAEILVFPAAASYVKGKFSFAAGRTKDSLSIWTTVSRSVLRLAPGATALEAVTIRVPKRASSGERYAVVWAEVSAPSPTQSGVRLVNRVGVRMYVSVGKGGSPPARFTVGSLRASRSTNGDPLVVAKVSNVGQPAIDVTGALTLSGGPGGLAAGPFPVMLGTLLAPSHSSIERVQLSDQIPRGPWRAELTLSGDGTRESSVTEITFPVRTLTNGRRSLALPLTLSVLILVLILATGGSVVRSRRRRLRFK
jgi:hypothetical protein